MPQPTGSDLHVSKLLSNLSVAFMNEPSAYVADKAFPIITVNKESDSIAVYRAGDWFRHEDTYRAPLTESKGVGFGIETPSTYFCRAHSVHQDISNNDLYNADDVFDVQEDAVSYTSEKLKISREVLFGTNFFGTGIWALDLQGQTDTPGANEFLCWDQSGSTPIEDIEGAKTQVLLRTGLRPNTIIAAERVHKVLKNHTDIRDHYKYVIGGQISKQQIAAAFEVDNYHVASAVLESGAEGGTSSMGYLLNQYGLLLMYVAPRPSKRRGSAGYIFRWNRPLIGGNRGPRMTSRVAQIPMPLKDGVRIETTIYEDIKLISTSCGVFMNNCIAANRTIAS